MTVFGNIPKKSKPKSRRPRLPKLVNVEPLELPDWLPGGHVSPAKSARHHTFAGTTAVSSVYVSSPTSPSVQPHKSRLRPKLEPEPSNIRLTGRQRQIIQQNKQQMATLDKIWDDLEYLYAQKTPRERRLRRFKKQSPIELIQVGPMDPRINLTLALKRKARCAR